METERGFPPKTVMDAAEQYLDRCEWWTTSVPLYFLGRLLGKSLDYKRYSPIRNKIVKAKLDKAHYISLTPDERALLRL